MAVRIQSHNVAKNVANLRDGGKGKKQEWGGGGGGEREREREREKSNSFLMTSR